MADAVLQYESGLVNITAEGAIAKGQIFQLKDGRACFATNAIAAGDPGIVQVEGVVRITKTAGLNILNGGEVYWDHSASAAHYKPVNDQDFFVGCAVNDFSTTSTVVDVDLNKSVRYVIDCARDAVLTVPVGTQGWNTMGAFRRGGASNFVLSATNEAQKLDIMSVDGFAKIANAIVEAVFTVPNGGAGTVVDVSIGVANGTNATDADAITEHVFCHIDSNSTKLNFQSKDGTTTVTATDSTQTYTAGTAVANRVYVWFDMRNPADVQIYVNGSLVLDSTVFNVNAASGPFFLLSHVEKTAAADTYELSVHSLKARIAEQ